ncbi:MAG TPA: hypothetical protein VNH11_16590 [Pirellulales bacterium]|nr:hypothetical protein [Pirellulales bacterium]
MATVTEKSASEKRTTLPVDRARRMLYETLFTPRPSTPFDDERATGVQLGIAPIYLKMKELGAILLQIVELANGEQHDEDGVLAPTKHAMDRTTRLLIHASMIVWHFGPGSGEMFVFPRGFIATDSEGGLRIEWTKPGASLRLVIAAAESGKSYLYHEFAEKYGSERQVTAELLGRWLARFLSTR